MTLYECNFCGSTKEVGKATIIYHEKKWVTKEALCHCGHYMESKPVDGMPILKRTEASLSKKKRGDMLWDSAKEKLIGERGVNESYD
jgi:MinD superfamily P-loop ATPase